MAYRFARRMEMVRDSSFLSVLDKAETVEGMISFAAGMPAPELFPIEDIIRSNTETLRREGEFALQYGAVEGHPPLAALLRRRMSGLGIPAEVENVLVTSGSQQALDFVGKLFLDSGDVVICESPTYMGALSAFEPYEPRFVCVEMDEDGIIPQQLEAALEQNPQAKFIYLIPDFQNPTGRTISLARRREILELSYRFDIPIVEDGPYTELRFEGEPIPPIKSMDTRGTVIYLGTLSKIFCPGFRIGWICADRVLIERFVALKVGADLQTSLLLQRQAAGFLEGFDMDDHIRRINALYRDRRDAMLAAIKANFPPGTVTYTRPKGGLFVWMSFPPGISTAVLLEKCLDEKVSAIPGEAFYPDNPGRAFCRLNFSFMPQDRIEEGIRRLANVTRSLL